MNRKKKIPNNHKRVTPSSANKKDDKNYTSHDTRRSETSTPQKVREEVEPAGEHRRMKRAKGT
jgi:hypothetical protein